MVNALKTIKLVRPLHNGLEYSVQTDDKRYVITASDFRNIGEEILCAGNSIDEYIQSELKFCTEKLSCIQKAFCHLDYSDMPEMKLRSKLRGKFSPEAIDAAMEILKENGYVDDFRLAMALCEMYYIKCQLGKKKIVAKLLQKQISRDVIRNVIEEYEFTDEQTWENMSLLVYNKFGEELTKETKVKATEYLISRGYSFDEAKSFVSENC